jgi:bacteriocin-like protein
MPYSQEPTELEPIELNDAELAAVSGGFLNFSNSLNNVGNVSNSTANASGTNSIAALLGAIQV